MWYLQGFINEASLMAMPSAPICRWQKFSRRYILHIYGVLWFLFGLKYKELKVVGILVDGSNQIWEITIMLHYSSLLKQPYKLFYWFLHFHLFQFSRQAEISASVLPIPTAISTRAFEIASLLPSCMSSGVIGIPSFLAMASTFSVFGLALKAEVNLWRDCWAFIKPWSWAAGSPLSMFFSKSYCYWALLASAAATA